MAAVMANVVAGSIAPRQTLTTPTDGDLTDENRRYVPFWYTRDGVIVKWSLFLGLFLFIGLYVFLGHMHAKRRLRKGLVPLAYHRWLVSRAELARVNPAYAYPVRTGVGYSNYRPEFYGYGMHDMPPPVYDPNAQRPPVYDGPEGGSKTAPSQWGNAPTHRPGNDDYAPPPGPPPPPAVTATHTGSSNNPYRRD